MYLLFAAYPAQGWASLVVRSTIPTERIEPAVGQAMLSVDPRQPIFHLQPMTMYIALSVAQRTFTPALIAAFGGLALALAFAGVYGVASYVTEQRRHEVGLRLALGASPIGVRRMILWPPLRCWPPTGRSHERPASISSPFSGRNSGPASQ